MKKTNCMVDRKILVISIFNLKLFIQKMMMMIFEFINHSKMSLLFFHLIRFDCKKKTIFQYTKMKKKFVFFCLLVCMTIIN